MEKDFDAWNEIKKRIDNRKRVVYANRREVWWCYFGLNIGTELYGKNDMFERPVVILKVYNKETLKIVPLTSNDSNQKYNFRLELNGVVSYASLAQAKTISTKRLSRKIGRISSEQFGVLIEKYKDSLG